MNDDEIMFAFGRAKKSGVPPKTVTTIKITRAALEMLLLDARRHSLDQNIVGVLFAFTPTSLDLVTAARIPATNTRFAG
jgi:hypothetical protein